MKELSLNILDIAQNSVSARADLIQILISENSNEMNITIIDNGCGMDAEMLKNVTSPFSTTRKTRSVGLGLPLFKMQAEQTGGWMKIDSVSEKVSSEHGTTVEAFFYKTSIDFTPLGNIIDTICALIMSSDQPPNNYELLFRHQLADSCVAVDTRELKQILGDEIPLSSPEVITWIREYLTEQYNGDNN